VLFAGRTAWARSLQTPLRQFLRTETGSAVVLLAATVAALVWANVSSRSYEHAWGTRLSVIVGGSGVSQSLGGWVNSGLMTFFFLVVGLEARREFDLGDLRERRRPVLPLLAGVGGTGAARVAEDVESADLSGVSGTPTFFINGVRHYGAYDIATLTAAVKAARARAAINA
jgi:hypothetical protein